MTSLPAARNNPVRPGLRHLRQVSPRSLVLGLMAVLLLLSPVSYKAGTDTRHPHTIFQAMVDQMRGTTHSHGEATSPGPAEAAPSFLDLDVPLSVYSTLLQADDVAHALHRIAPNLALSIDPDVPEFTALHGPVEQGTVLPMLAILAGLLAGWILLRRVWLPQDRLQGIAQSIESPPPR